jgi:hypothetical protein
MVDPHDDAERTATQGDPGPDAPPTETELREARALAAALEGDAGPSEDATFLRTLTIANAAPEAFPLSSELNERLVSRALSAKAGSAPTRGRVIRVLFGGAVALAAAAALVFLVGKPPELESAKLAQSRSTQDLFREPFRGDEASARIDRIAMARAGDLRENRFARWGVR